MKKALILTVGLSENDVEKILFSIRKQNPDTILFILTSNSKSITLEKIKSSLDKNDYKILEKIFDEINDLEIIIMEYSKYISELKGEGFESEEIFIDFTCGTKPMTAGLMYAALEHNISTISYIYGQRDLKGSVIKNTERINTIPPNAIYTDKQIDQAIYFFNKYQYSVSIDIINSIKRIHPNFSDKIQLLLNLSKVYYEWDRFNFMVASNLLNDLSKNNMIGTIIDKDIIQSQKRDLHDLKNSNFPNTSLINDLYSNALRRYDECKYDDSIARLYRCLEMIGQFHFFNHFGIPNTKFPFEQLPENLKSDLIIKKDSQEKIDLALKDTFKVLKELNLGIAKVYFENELEIKKMLTLRNQSILAHGISPIEKESIKKLFELFESKLGVKRSSEFPKLFFSLI